MAFFVCLFWEMEIKARNPPFTKSNRGALTPSSFRRVFKQSPQCAHGKSWPLKNSEQMRQVRLMAVSARNEWGHFHWGISRRETLEAVSVVTNPPHMCAPLCDYNVLSPHVASLLRGFWAEPVKQAGAFTTLPLPPPTVDRETGWRILTTASTILDTQETEGCWENPAE